MAIDWIASGYSATILAGGVLGYVKGGSVISLAAGTLFGGIAGYGAYRSSNNPLDQYLNLGISTVLGGMMGSRYIKSGKMMPAGLIAGMSVVMVAHSAYILLTAPKTEEVAAKAE